VQEGAAVVLGEAQQGMHATEVDRMGVPVTEESETFRPCLHIGGQLDRYASNR
jgi:predicted transcriptional regulator of viral defense system